MRVCRWSVWRRAIQAREARSATPPDVIAAAISFVWIAVASVWAEISAPAVEVAMKNTKKLAFSALMAALGVSFMYIGALLEVLDLSTAALASICVMLVLTEPYGVEKANRMRALILSVKGGLNPSACGIHAAQIHKRILERIEVSLVVNVRFRRLIARTATISTIARKA